MFSFNCEDSNTTMLNAKVYAWHYTSKSRAKIVNEVASENNPSLTIAIYKELRNWSGTQADSFLQEVYNLLK